MQKKTKKTNYNDYQSTFQNSFDERFFSVSPNEENDVQPFSFKKPESAAGLQERAYGQKYDQIYGQSYQSYEPLYTQTKQQLAVQPSVKPQEGVKSKSKSVYIKGFDGLRAVSLIFVMLYHWFPDTVKGGYLGVISFLTLSGYLITDGFLREHAANKSLDITNFYVRRLKKIYPPLIFFLVLIASWVYWFQPQALYDFRPGFLSSLFAYNNWWQIFNQSSYFEQFTNIKLFTHIWTLAVEIQFYILWPLILSVVHKIAVNKFRSYLQKIVVILSIIFSILSFVVALQNDSINRVYLGTDSRAFSFLLGAALACFISSERIKDLSRFIKLRLLNIISAVFCLFLFTMFFILQGNGGFAYYGGMLIFNLMLILLMPLCACEQTVIGKIFASLPLQGLSRRSYSLYLWQFPIIMLSFHSLKIFAVARPARFFVELFILIIMAEISYQLCEVRLFGFAGLKKQKLLRIISLILLTFLTLSSVLALFASHNELSSDLQELQNRLKMNKELGNNSAQSASINDKEKQDQENKDQEATKNKTETENSDKKINENTADNTKESGTAQVDNEGNKSAEAVNDINNSVYVAKLNKYLPAKLDTKNKVADFPFAVEEVPDLKYTDFEAALAKNLPITMVGDSVLLGSKDTLFKIFPLATIDAEVSRQFAAGAAAIDAIAGEGKLSKVIVVALGTNGVISAEQVNNFCEKYADHHIYLVNTVVNNQSEGIANKAIADAIARQPNTVLIDWYSLAKSKSGWFSSDFVHPSVDGRYIYSQLIAKKVLEHEIKLAKDMIDVE